MYIFMTCVDLFLGVFLTAAEDLMQYAWLYITLSAFKTKGHIQGLISLIMAPF